MNTKRRKKNWNSKKHRHTHASPQHAVVFVSASLHLLDHCGTVPLDVTRNCMPHSKDHTPKLCCTRKGKLQQSGIGFFVGFFLAGGDEGRRLVAGEFRECSEDNCRWETLCRMQRMYVELGMSTRGGRVIRLVLGATPDTSILKVSLNLSKSSMVNVAALGECVIDGCVNITASHNRNE